MAAVFAYWNARGLGQSIRLLMAHVNDDAIEKTYIQTAVGSLTPAEIAPEWFVKDKHNLSLDFPNLPYYIDGTVKITESKAILRHLARKHKLDGSSEEAKICIDMVSEVCTQFHKNLIGLCYDPDYEEKKDKFAAETAQQFELLENFLSCKPYFTGDNISWLDFYIYEVLFQYRFLWPDLLQRLPKLTAFMNGIELLPRIQAFMATDKYKGGPLYGVTAVNQGYNLQ